MLQRLIGYVILAPAAIVIVALSVANRAPAVLSFDPVNVDPLYALEAPLYLFLFAAFAAGGIAASVVTWLRQGRWRRRAREEAARAARLEQEIDRLQKKVRSTGPAPASPMALVPAGRDRDAA